MHYRYYDNLRQFAIVARHSSFSAAADTLCLTKGAVSHLVRQLEEQLGFPLFHRHAKGIFLTPKGNDLLTYAETAFDTLDQNIAALQSAGSQLLTIGVSTYFASRWLSSRLMGFLADHQEIRLRIQPMVDLHNLAGEGVDIAIRWGDGNWTDAVVEPLFACPAWPCGNAATAKMVADIGIARTLESQKLLHDRDGSLAWTEWYHAAGLGAPVQPDRLIIPDPNVRVQAVLDGQGVALNDDLIAAELEAGTLFRLSDIALEHYGYFLVYRPNSFGRPEIDTFIHWIKAEGATFSRSASV